MPVGIILLGAGLLIGIVFGATALRTNFCVMGSVTDILLTRDYRRFRAWLLAIAVAVLGTQLLAGFGLVDLHRTPYLAPNLGWLGAILGGLLFGFGMTLSGGCGQRSLVRVGAGSLKSLTVVIVLGIFAYMTAHGITGLGRIRLEAATNIDLAAFGQSSQALDGLIAAAFGLGAAQLRWVVVALFAGALFWLCFKDRMFRASGRNIAAGLILGALVPLGWLITSTIGAGTSGVPESLSFVAPVGDGLQYLMRGAGLSFGVAVVAGVVLGSFLAVVASGRFRIEAFDSAQDMVHHLAGGALMGVGGALTLGGTIGQGMSGVSTLALGSILAWLAIIAGAVLGLKYLERASEAYI